MGEGGCASLPSFLQTRALTFSPTALKELPLGLSVLGLTLQVRGGDRGQGEEGGDRGGGREGGEEGCASLPLFLETRALTFSPAALKELSLGLSVLGLTLQVRGGAEVGGNGENGERKN